MCLQVEAGPFQCCVDYLLYSPLKLAEETLYSSARSLHLI